MNQGPYATGTYSPMAEQQQGQQNPYQNAYNNYSQGFQPQTGPARTFNLGTQASPSEFAQRDQSYIPGMATNFENAGMYGYTNNAFGSGYRGDQMEDYRYVENLPGTTEKNEQQLYFQTRAPTQNLKNDFGSFDEAQKYYRDYLNMTQGLTQNASKSMQQGSLDFAGQYSNHDWNPSNPNYQHINSQFDTYRNLVQQRQQAALDGYLRTYNQFGQRGAFGSGFQNRTTPFKL